MSKVFDDIKTSLEEVKRMISGELVPPYEVHIEDHLLVRIRENGETIWTLEDAVDQLNETDLSHVKTPAEFFRTVRDILKQGQAGMARIYGVPVRTYERWERDERINSRASAKTSLIRLMAKEPAALVRAARNPAPEIGFTSSP